MSTGIWTLECQTCGHSFELKLKAEFETVIDSVMSRACTGCKKVPIERPKTDWHHNMRYRHPAGGGGVLDSEQAQTEKTPGLSHHHGITVTAYPRPFMHCT